MLSSKHMLLLCVFAVTILVASAKITSLHPMPKNAPTRPPKEYKLDMDLPPYERWKDIILDNKAGIVAFHEYVHSVTHLPDWAFHFASYSHAYNKNPEFAEELQAIANLTEVDFSFLYIVNYLYEISAWCTSTIVRTASGKIIHGRNLDFPFERFIANLSAKVSVYRGSQYLYDADFVLGVLTIHAGIKPGKFAISINEREKGSIFENLREYLYEDSIGAPYLVRKILENATTFDEAVQMASTVRIIAPAYYTISGVQPHEGVIITRSATEVTNAHWLKDNTPDWFILVTNYDRGEIEPANDYRSLPGENRLNLIGQNITEQQLMDEVMAKFPTLNIETIITVIMVPSTGYFNSTIWY